MRTPYWKIRSFGQRLLLIPLVVLAVGCSGEGTITGHVYYKGKMLTSGAINFVSEGTGKASGGQISRDGTYTVSKVPRGAAKIGILSGGSSMGVPKFGPGGPGGMKGPPAGKGGVSKEKMEKYKEKLKEMRKGAPPSEAEGPTEAIEVPQKYANPETSGLQVEVTGGRQEHDIKID